MIRASFLVLLVTLALSACSLSKDLGGRSAALDKPAAELSPYGEKDPRNYLAASAKEAEKEKNYFAAAGLWGSIADQYPDFKPAIVGFSENAIRIGSPHRALGYLFTYQSKHPEDRDIRFQTVKTLYAAKKYRDAFKEIDQLTTEEPNNWRYYSMRGVAADALNYNTESEYSFKKALELAPDHPTVLNNYAMSLKKRGRIADATRAVAAASAVKGAPDAVHVNYAEFLILQGRNTEAMKLLEERFGKDAAETHYKAVYSRLSQPAYWKRGG